MDQSASHVCGAARVGERLWLFRAVALAVVVIALLLPGQTRAATLVSGFNGPDSFSQAIVDVYDYEHTEVVRIWTNWCSLHPTGSDYTASSSGWNHTAMNNLTFKVSDAQGHGFTPLVLIGTAAPNEVDDRQAYKPGDPPCLMTKADGTTPRKGWPAPANTAHASDHYAAVARAVVQCLRDASRANGCPTGGNGADTNLVQAGMQGIEIGNEPNNARFWLTQNGTITQSDANRFTNMVNEAATEIQGVSGIKVATGGLFFPAGTNCWGTCITISPIDYLQQMYIAAGILGSHEWDAVAIHPYGAGLHTEEADFVSAVSNTKSVLANASPADTTTPLWVTEVGDDSGVGGECVGVPGSCNQARQSTNLQNIWSAAKSYCAAAQNPLKLLIYYRLEDAETEAARMGVVKTISPLDTKAAYETLHSALSNQTC